jgi:hypothetical protein
MVNLTVSPISPGRRRSMSADMSSSCVGSSSRRRCSDERDERDESGVQIVITTASVHASPKKRMLLVDERERSRNRPRKLSFLSDGYTTTRRKSEALEARLAQMAL